MSNEQVHIERRHMQRFTLHLPVSIRRVGSDQETSGYTQDLSARGVLLYTDLEVDNSDAVEVTFIMPAEITLAETMRVRCRGKVVRIAPPSGGMARGVAVRIEGYEFLSEPESLAHRSASLRPAQVPIEATPEH
jgi:hypothetical protein